MNRLKISSGVFRNRSFRGLWRLKRMGTFILRASIFLGLAFYLQACDTLKTAKETNNMSMPEKISTKKTVKPPLDLSAPDKIKTATFALG
ncbi:MAG: hypothetical protein HKO79_08265 [Desulfobacterales bacterium]|nr:hypothetical protein [Deltaproteobacteria bacterium]NNL42477.1 hypothetical protein [Desulfobacterales bacterium]